MILKIPQYELIRQKLEVYPDIKNCVYVIKAEYRLKDKFVNNSPIYVDTKIILGQSKAPYYNKPAIFETMLEKQARQAANRHIIKIMLHLLPKIAINSWF